MKLIAPKVELWNQGNTLDEIWEHIARCARVCYQSEPRKNGETGEQFVNRVILHNHSYEEIAKDRAESILKENAFLMQMKLLNLQDF